ncbi:MAG: FAD-dependent thymidylate synthase [Alphaproteobacteria bacterium]|nr:FAD-dependent thymidylate synthase [Alphaproteobacteria bacterium]
MTQTPSPVFAPTITLLAKTEVTPEGRDKMKAFYSAARATQDRDFDPGPQELIEFAGRKCYDADGRKNSETSTAEGYLGNIIEQRHFSVLEHVSYTFQVDGISRACSHEWVRHRHGSYSQQSQRFVLATKHSEVVIPPAIQPLLWEGDFSGDPLKYSEILQDILFAHEENYERYEFFYQDLRDRREVDHKQASEAARCFIPNAAATDLTVTGNVRYWMEFISKRDADGADAEIRIAAQEIEDVLIKELPEVFSPEARALWSEDSVQKGVK